MISPAIGRVVLFHPANEILGAQPCPALVSYVHNDRLINIGGFGPNGELIAATSVILLQDGDGVVSGTPYAEWMPYQKVQAQVATATTPANTPA